MTTLAALLHTYYLPRFGRCFGALANDAELCDRLRREWEARSQPDDEPHISDGISVWLDRQDKPHVCIVRSATARMVDDAALVEELAKLVASAATSADGSGAPGHPPA